MFPIFVIKMVYQIGQNVHAERGFSLDTCCHLQYKSAAPNLHQTVTPKLRYETNRTVCVLLITVSRVKLNVDPLIIIIKKPGFIVLLEVSVLSVKVQMGVKLQHS